MKIKVGDLKRIIRETVEELAEASAPGPAALRPVAAQVIKANKPDLEAAFEEMTPEDLAALESLASGASSMNEGQSDFSRIQKGLQSKATAAEAVKELKADLELAAADVQDVAMAAGVSAAMLDVFKQCAVDYASATGDLLGRVHGTNVGPSLADFGGEVAMVGAAAGLAALTAATVLSAYKIWKKHGGKKNPNATEGRALRLTPDLLRKIISEEAAEAHHDAAAELEASAADWVEDNYDALLAKLQDDPKLTDAILAAAGVNESYVGDLAKGVGDYYSGGAVRGNINPMLIPSGASALGYLGAEIMALVKDPSLMPWTTLRSLQLDDKITMDGSAGKAMIVGALLGHLVDVARHAKEFADTSARNSALMARGRSKKPLRR